MRAPDDGIDGARVPPSPPARRVRRPRWLDVRLVVGVVIVVVAVLIGATVFARADRTTSVWSLTHDLQAGAVLTASDLRPADVRMDATASRYVPTSDAVVGQRLGRGIGVGELLARSAISDATTATGQVTLTIPFETANVPAVVRGDRITVWVSTRDCASVPVLQDVAVQDVSEPGGALASRDTVNVVVSLDPDLAQRVVAALALDQATLRAGVLTGPTPSPSPTVPSGTSDLIACTTSSPVPSATAS